MVSKEVTAVSPCGAMRTISFCSTSFLVAASMSPSSSKASILLSAAEKNRSTGAPSSICVCKAPLPPKVKETSVPGYSSWNVCASSLRTSVKLAAAETVIAPVTASCPSLLSAACSLPQPASMPAVKANANKPSFFFMFFLLTAHILLHLPLKYPIHVPEPAKSLPDFPAPLWGCPAD